MRHICKVSFKAPTTVPTGEQTSRLMPVFTWQHLATLLSQTANASEKKSSCETSLEVFMAVQNSSFHVSSQPRPSSVYDASGAGEGPLNGRSAARKPQKEACDPSLRHFKTTAENQASNWSTPASVKMVKLMLYGSTALVCLRLVLIRIQLWKRRPKDKVVRAVINAMPNALAGQHCWAARSCRLARTPGGLGFGLAHNLDRVRKRRLNQVLKPAVVRVRGNFLHMGLQLWPSFMRFVRPFCNALLGLGPLLHAQSCASGNAGLNMLPWQASSKQSCYVLLAHLVQVCSKECFGKGRRSRPQSAFPHCFCNS